jgi:hypothetical protein
MTRKRIGARRETRPAAMPGAADRLPILVAACKHRVPPPLVWLVPWRFACRRRRVGSGWGRICDFALRSGRQREGPNALAARGTGHPPEAGKPSRAAPTTVTPPASARAPSRGGGKGRGARPRRPGGREPRLSAQ